MRRFVFSALLALLLAAPFALTSAAADPDGIGVIAGPFESRMDDAAGDIRDVVCAYVVRTQLDNRTYREESFCYFLPGATLPRYGFVRHDNETTEGPFWSDYTFELTGELEQATTWSITAYADGTVVAESTYGPEPLDDDSAEFAGWIGGVIPNPEGGVVQLSPAGASSQAKYGISDDEILEAWNDGVEVDFEGDSVEYEGRWAAGVLVYWIDGHTLLNLRAASWADIQALD